MADKFYITTPIYYVNDKPHIGHAYTTIAADVLARYHRMKGENVFFLAGTDEHGTKVAQSAEEVGKDPQTFCDEMAAQFQVSWDSLNISNDKFIRTTSEEHKKAVQKFLIVLKDKGAIYEGKYKGLYCTGCEKFLTEKELVDGKCPDHQKEPEKISEKNYFFKLKDYLNKVKKLIEEDKIKVEPEAIKKEVLGLFKQDLQDFSVSREKVKWGIELPFDKSQKVYVWVDALLNYISALGYSTLNTQYSTLNFQKYWPADVHLMAKDIIKFHAIYWPAMLFAAGLKVPKEIYAHGFFTINGRKMSKSLGNIIDPNDLVKKFGADATRYLLLSQFPFGQDGDIKESKFTEQYNADLANDLGNLLGRVLTMTEKYFNGKIPADSKENYFKMKEKWNDFESSINNLELYGALEIIRDVIGSSNKYIDKEKPWVLAEKDKERLSVVIYKLLEILRHIAWMLQPFIPETSNKIFEQLGLENEIEKSLDEAMEWGGIKTGTKIKKGEPLFPRI